MPGFATANTLRPIGLASRTLDLRYESTSTYLFHNFTTTIMSHEWCMLQLAYYWRRTEDMPPREIFKRHGLHSHVV